MSSLTSCFLFFLLCLSLSLHACTARRLGAVDHHNNNKLQKKLHFSIKSDMKISGLNKKPDVIVVEAKSLSSIKEERIYQADDDTQKLLDAEVMTNHETVENEKEKTSGAVLKTNNKSSVSWRVPHRKHGEKHPGFNLDYSPPKTHPPSHN